MAVFFLIKKNPKTTTPQNPALENLEGYSNYGKSYVNITTYYFSSFTLWPFSRLLKKNWLVGYDQKLFFWKIPHFAIFVSAERDDMLMCGLWVMLSSQYLKLLNSETHQIPKVSDEGLWTCICTVSTYKLNLFLRCLKNAGDKTYLKCWPLTEVSISETDSDFSSPLDSSTSATVVNSGSLL